MVNRILFKKKKGSVRDSVWIQMFDLKHLKKAEEHISRNVLSITIKMRSIVRIFIVKAIFFTCPFIIVNMNIFYLLVWIVKTEENMQHFQSIVLYNSSLNNAQRLGTPVDSD